MIRGFFYPHLYDLHPLFNKSIGAKGSLPLRLIGKPGQMSGLPRATETPVYQQHCLIDPCHWYLTVVSDRLFTVP